MVEENVCCYCNEANQYCSRVNAGTNYYCMKCIAKIEKLGIDYWRECSSTEFYDNMLKDMRKGKAPRPEMDKPIGEFSILESLREHMREMGIDVPERKRKRKRK